MQPTLITSKENYLGIEIDQSRDAKLNSFSKETLKDRYLWGCLLYTSPSPRDGLLSRMPSSA